MGQIMESRHMAEDHSIHLAPVERKNPNMGKPPQKRDD